MIVHGQPSMISMIPSRGFTPLLNNHFRLQKRSTTASQAQKQYFFKHQSQKSTYDRESEQFSRQNTISNPGSIMPFMQADENETKKSQHQLRRKLNSYMSVKYNGQKQTQQAQHIEDISMIMPRIDSQPNESFQDFSDFCNNNPQEKRDAVESNIYNFHKASEGDANKRRDSKLIPIMASKVNLDSQLRIKRNELIMQVYQQPNIPQKSTTNIPQKSFLMQGKSTGTNFWKKRDVKTQQDKWRNQD